MNKIRSFIKKFGRKQPEKPATIEEIEQLKLNYEREVLRAAIAKEKANMPKSGIAKFLNQIKTTDTQTKSKRKHQARQDNEAYLKRIKDGFNI